MILLSETFNSYDLLCGGVALFGILYGYGTGILNMIKPLISIIVARFLSGYVRSALHISSIAESINNIAAEKTGLPTDNTLIEMGSTMVADAIISVLAFIISYIAIRLILSLIFSSMRLSRIGVAYKLDKILGGTIGFVVAGSFIYCAYLLNSALANIGFTSAMNMARGISASAIGSKIVILFGILFQHFGINLFIL